ncbi:MAG: DUF3426 domain-containing protein [Desulfovibrio sp.]|nr:DUF3426 domain-containing protein [Desulfovibrio sp.]
MPVQETQVVTDDFGQASGDAVVSETAPPVSLPIWKKHLSALIAATTIGLLCVLGYGGVLIYRSLTAPGSATATKNSDDPRLEKQAEYERLIGSISLDEVRQFVVNNVNIGRIAVIQGVAVNISKTPKEYIVVEAKLMDADKRILAQVKQLCGVPLTLFQLQSLSAGELKETLNNRISILTNNTNIPSGGKVNFAIVFTKVPENMRTFEVRVIDVREAPAR